MADADMNGSFSFLNDNEYHFVLDGGVQGRIARLNGQMARIYFVKMGGETVVEELILAPAELEVRDTTLKEVAPRMPPNNDIILMWTSDYEIHYKGLLLVQLKMQRQYSCREAP
jgi:hypothetical protein